MYVLMDLEWVSNGSDGICPSQVAAMRVDQAWQETDSFYARFAPRDNTFYNWNQVGYAGGSAEDYLGARSSELIFQALQEWFEDDDVLCFWHEEASAVFRSEWLQSTGSELRHNVFILRDYLFPYLQERNIKIGSAYQVAKRSGQTVPKLHHHAHNDVQAIRLAFVGSMYPQELLEQETPPNWYESCPIPEDKRPFVYDEGNGVYHHRDCTHLPKGTQFSFHASTKYMRRNNITPCRFCMPQHIREERIRRNQDIINRTAYEFVYSVNSDVFHRRDCKVVLSTNAEIRGAVYYHVCKETGRRPCKLCHPKGSSWIDVKKAKKEAKRNAKGGQQIFGRDLNGAEQRAYDRFREARKERDRYDQMEFKSETEREDFFTLTQPRFAFWAAAGYQNFHLRKCKKLSGVENLKGFSRYNDAIRAGHTPCKCCQPTKKHDIQCSIPITNKKDLNERVEDLEEMCNQHGYPFRKEQNVFWFETPVGRWKIKTAARPYVVLHINRVMTPDNEDYYHRQPRLFLSLRDAFKYIHRHDKEIQERGQSKNKLIDHCEEILTADLAAI